MNVKELTQVVQELLAQRKVNEAFKLLQNTIDANPKFVEAWMLLGSIFRAMGQLDKAIDVCIQASQKIPDNSTIWNNLGHLYMEQGLNDQAIEPIKRGLSIDPKNSSGWYSLGQVLVGKKEYAQAIEAFEKAIKIAPNRAEVWNALGSVCEDNEQYKDSIKAYKKALELQPDLFNTMVGLGMVYATIGDFKDAIKIYKKYLKVEPDNEVLWFRLGTAFTGAGKLDDAIKAIKKGLKMNPTIVQAWMDLHDIYKKKGDEDKAKWAMGKAVGTGKVDIKFARNGEEVQSKIKEWEQEQKNRTNELDSMVEKRIFPSWSFRVQPDYEEHPDGNRIQLISPDGSRCITTSALTLGGQATPEIIANLGKQYEQAGSKKKVDIKHKDYTGFVFENDQFTHEDIFLIQCTMAAPTGILMLTFSIPDTKEDKDWAMLVIRNKNHIET
ncbi:hypothetical protein LCGC14_1733670 [marine sediment metagenome]|uniref:Uncharacterized protein n=1 Tax=marine sediment metagenome TaxID=412755 RepID=A0A0F9K8D9_9ZZZZ